MYADHVPAIRSRGARAHCARTAARAPCSATSSSSARSARERSPPSTRGDSCSASQPAQQGLLGRLPSAPTALPALCRMLVSQPRRLHRVCPVPCHISGLGGELGRGIPVQLDRGLAPARSLL